MRVTGEEVTFIYSFIRPAVYCCEVSAAAASLEEGLKEYLDAS